MAAKRKFDTELKHQQFQAWHKARSQAHFRGEQWQLPIEHWFELWQPDLWALRGRSQLSMCITRRDSDRPWSRDNCKIVPRLEHLRNKELKNKTCWWQQNVEQL